MPGPAPGHSSAAAAADWGAGGLGRAAARGGADVAGGGAAEPRGAEPRPRGVAAERAAGAGCRCPVPRAQRAAHDRLSSRPAFPGAAAGRAVPGPGDPSRGSGERHKAENRDPRLVVIACH